MKKTGFIPRLESLRGIAALTVVGYHVNNQLSDGATYGWLDTLAGRVIGACANGTGAVVTFFVLSGFVLARSLDGNSDPVRFLRHRLFRLFPAAAATVALLTVLYWKFGFFVGFKASFDPANVILNMLMIRSDIDVVMWSMTVECVATPLILLSVWILQKRGEPQLWGLMVVLIGLSSWGPYVHLLGGFTNLAPLYAFIVGVLIHFRGEQRASSLGPGGAIAVAIISVALFCFCGSRTQSALVLLLECLSAAAVIALIAWRPAMGLFKPFDFRPVRFYGQISYSFYLLHLIGISAAFRLTDPAAWNAGGLPRSVTVIFATAIAILLTTPAAYLSWRFIEIPAINFGRSLGPRRTQAVIVGGGAEWEQPR
ncbi:MAG TPA: acyltransferase [Bradyrhizobium sp.]|nr:acyltransferase [Bradyrhizobium sp.]